MQRSVGIIVPSANVVVERTAIAYAAATPGLDVHFTRIPVRGDQTRYVNTYDTDAFFEAADLLADVRPDVMLWAGSKGVLIGVEHDRRLLEEIEFRTGIPFTTSSLALVDLAQRRNIRRIGLITPYTSIYQRRLIEGFARIGLQCIAESHAGISDNLSYANVSTDSIVTMACEVSTGRPDAVLSWCTNFPSSACCEEVAAKTGVPFYDATLIGLDDAIAKFGGPIPVLGGC